MSNAITAPPNQYDFGYEFNYALWTEGTIVTLVNVPWNNDYRDIVKFASRAALNTYIDGLQTSGVVVHNVSYVKPNMPIRLDIPFNAAYKYNYLRANNPLQPISGDIDKDYYYFITDVRYIAPNTTELVLQLDVWQTFGYDVTFGNCYIERGHIGIANSNAFNNYGRDYLSVAEGFDVGSEYQIIHKENTGVITSNSTGQPDVTVVVVSTVDLLADPGSVNAPVLKSAYGGQAFGLATGAAYYLWQTAAQFENWLFHMTNFPWITQGIVSITCVPNLSRYYGNTIVWPSDSTPINAPNNAPPTVQHPVLNNWRSAGFIGSYLGSRYSHLTKFLTYPYMVIECTTFSGSPIIIKPESWRDDNATIIERANLLPPDQRVAFMPFKYNATDDLTDSYVPDGGFTNWGNVGDDHGDYMDFATYISNFPTVAIVNNMAINYLASNAHGLMWQNQSADWSQQRALAGNQVSYDQSTGAMSLANQLTGIGNAAMNAQNTIQNNKIRGSAVVEASKDVLSGLITGSQTPIIGGLANASAAAFNGLLAVGANTDSTNVAMSAARRSTNAQVGQQGYIRDTNKSLADWAAKGDYGNNIAAISAKVQDSKLTQPSSSGQVGGDAMNAVTGNSIFSLRWKTLDKANMRAIGEYWLRYGYSVRQFAPLPASLQVMTKFTYWKLLETYVSAATMPESMKQIIRGIFEKGVTVWASPAYIGVTDLADNQPLTGITLPS